MRLSDLRDKKVRSLDGETLGRVHEVHCNKGRVTALVCGAGGFLERLTAKGGATDSLGMRAEGRCKGDCRLVRSAAKKGGAQSTQA